MRRLADQPHFHAWRAAVAVCLVVGVGASCGDDSPSDNAQPNPISIPASVALPTTIPIETSTTATIASESSTTSSTTTTTTTPVSTPLTVATPTPTGPQGETEFCRAAFQAELSSRAIDDLGDTASATAEQVAEAYRTLKVAANHAFDTAPTELERATAIMKSVFNEVDALMAEHGYNPQQTFADPRYEDLTHKAEQPEVVAANEDYQSFLTNQCGFGQ